MCVRDVTEIDCCFCVLCYAVRRPHKKITEA
jgi:hypothetical protein